MFTLDSLVTVVYNTLLNPWLTLPLAGAYMYAAPEDLKLVLSDLSQRCIPEFFVSSPTVRKGLYIMLGSIALRAIKFLDRRALNNAVSDTYDWKKEVAVVTGGAGGIGANVVKQLASRGTRVAVLDVIPLTYSPPPNVEYFECDLMDATSLASAAKLVRARWGEPTVLCAIAGVVRGKPLLETSKRDLDLTFGVNCIAVALCYKEFVPAMVKMDHGHVVTMASATAYLATAGMVDYAASKAAALALHEGLQTELKHVYNAPKVRCTVLCPGIVATNMFSGLRSPSQFLSPVLTPQEVADAAVSALWAAESRHIEMPWIGKLMVMPLRAAPSVCRIALQDLGGKAMQTFSGHKTIN